LITVRLAQPSEYERVGALTIAAYEALAVDHLFGGYDEKILDTASRAKSSGVLVAVIDDRVVGSVTYVDDPTSEWNEWTEPGEAQFRLLAVAPEAHGRGAGLALVRECMARAEATNQPILIHTTPWMQTAQRMYDRLGFVRRPDRDAPYEVWNEDDYADLPAEWIGQAFLAFSWKPRNSPEPAYDARVH
jgi:ribosomal protein S18 acetylase RimI-like enzyme